MDVRGFFAIDQREQKVVPKTVVDEEEVEPDEEEVLLLHRVRILKWENVHNYEGFMLHIGNKKGGSGKLVDFEGLLIVNVVDTVYRVGRNSSSPESETQSRWVRKFKFNTLDLYKDGEYKWDELKVCGVEEVFKPHNARKVIRDMRNHLVGLFYKFNRESNERDSMVLVADVQRREVVRFELDPELEWLCNVIDAKCRRQTCVTRKKRKYNDDFDILRHQKPILKEVMEWRMDPSAKLVEVKPYQLKELELSPGARGSGFDIAPNEELDKAGDCAICWRKLGEGDFVPQSNDTLTWLPEDHSWHVVKLNCGHSYHHLCVFGWLLRNASCPYCRTPTSTFF